MGCTQRAKYMKMARYKKSCNFRCYTWLTYLNDLELILRIGSICNGFSWWSFICANRFEPLPQSALLADCSDSSLETPKRLDAPKNATSKRENMKKKTIHSMKLTNIPFKRFVEKLICLFQKSSVIFCQKGTHKQNSLRKILMFFDIWHLFSYWHIVTWPINRVSAHSPCWLVLSVARTMEAIEGMEAMAPKMEPSVPHAALASSGSTWDDSTTTTEEPRKKKGLTPYFPLFFSGWIRDPYIFISLL